MHACMCVQGMLPQSLGIVFQPECRSNKSKATTSNKTGSKQASKQASRQASKQAAHGSQKPPATNSHTSRAPSWRSPRNPAGDRHCPGDHRARPQLPATTDHAATPMPIRPHRWRDPGRFSPRWSMCIDPAAAATCSLLSIPPWPSAVVAGCTAVAAGCSSHHPCLTQQRG